MEITFNAQHGYTVCITAANVTLVKDVEDRVYIKTPDGKVDPTKHVVKDVSDEGLNLFAVPLQEAIYYRTRTFDSSDLIEKLFEKLPGPKAALILEKLCSIYPDE